MKIAITITILVLILVLAGALVSPVNAVKIEALPTDAGTEIGEIINTIYKNALGLGGIAALVMITIGAVYFTLSGASPDKQSEGKNYIASALWGLLLLFGAFIILNTINPQIIELAEPGKDAPKVGEVATTDLTRNEICESLVAACRAVYTDNLARTFTVTTSIPFIDCDDGCSEEIKVDYKEVPEMSICFARA